MPALIARLGKENEDSVNLPPLLSGLVESEFNFQIDKKQFLLWKNHVELDIEITIFMVVSECKMGGAKATSGSTGYIRHETTVNIGTWQIVLPEWL